MTIRHHIYQVPPPANGNQRRGARVVALQRTDYNHAPDRRIFLATAVGLTLAVFAFGIALVGGAPGASTTALETFTWGDTAR